MAAIPPSTDKASKKKNYLELKRKVEVIKTLGKNSGISIRTLARMFQCGKSQIAYILNNKVSILSMFESNASENRAHTSKTPRKSKYMEVNKALYEWYSLACSKNIYPGGTHLTEKVRQIAACLGKSNFKGSIGWLGKWKRKYNIKQLTICGESGDVQGKTVDSWKKERLPEILQDYAKDNVWNMDETGVFW